MGLGLWMMLHAFCLCSLYVWIVCVCASVCGVGGSLGVGGKCGGVDVRVRVWFVDVGASER